MNGYDNTKVVVRLTSFNKRTVNKKKAREMGIIVVEGLCSVVDEKFNYLHMVGKVRLPDDFWKNGGSRNLPLVLAKNTKVKKFRKIGGQSYMSPMEDSSTSNTWEGYLESRAVFLRYRDLPTHLRPKTITVIFRKAATEKAKSPVYGLAV